MKPVLLAGLVALGVGAGVFLLSGHKGGDSGSVMVNVTVPPLDAEQQAGAAAYAQNCASCHGENGAGRDGVGPPLVHIIYEPSHHADGAFYVAVQLGVRAHHWNFGDMPRQTHVTEGEIAQIIAYIRALQRANGID
jgi:mono/diheme cytochrome c family protein